MALSPLALLPLVSVMGSHESWSIRLHASLYSSILQKFLLGKILTKILVILSYVSNLWTYSFSTYSPWGIFPSYLLKLQNSPSRQTYFQYPFEGRNPFLPSIGRNLLLRKVVRFGVIPKTISKLHQIQFFCHLGLLVIILKERPWFDITSRIVEARRVE